ncbi:MAG: ImcF-related family protein, partial [Pseudomonadota bacterium]
SSSAMIPLNLAEELADGQADVVFRTVDGRPLDSLTVPALFTFSGYWGVFTDAVGDAAERLEDERWVLGPAGEEANYSGQLTGLNRDLHALYTNDFAKAWDEMLGRIDLVPMSSGAPQYPALTVAASETLSPILKLAELVDRETRLSRFTDALDNIELSVEAVASGDIGAQMADVGFSEVERRSGAIQRIFLNMFKDRAKFQERATNTVSSPGQMQQIETIERRFEKWHAFVKGDAPTPPVKALLQGLSQLADNRRRAGLAGSTAALDERGLQDALITLQTGAQSYPKTIVAFVNDIEDEFLTLSIDTNLEDLSRALNEEIAVYCTNNIARFYPFSSNDARHVSTNAFGEFFGYGGLMEAFYNERLRELTQLAPNGDIEPRDGSGLGSRLSPAMLSQFVRARSIREAFFEPGSRTPSVTFSIRQVGSSEGVEGSVVSLGERAIQLLPNSSGQQVRWPDDTTDIAVTLLPQRQGVANSQRYSGGRWAVRDFVTGGRASYSGTRVDRTFQVGGRAVVLRMEFDSNTIPFRMGELRDFSCPTSLE